MSTIQFVTLLCFGFLAVPCLSWGCLLQRNATHHLIEPCNEERNRPAIALATRQAHRLSTGNDPAPAGHGAPAPAGHGAAEHGAAPAAGSAEASSTSAKKPTAKVDLTSALRIELSMPVTIREIHEGPQGPLSHFLIVLHQQICKSASVLPQRISLLGIRGEYTKLETMLLDSSTLDGKGNILLLDGKQESDGVDEQQLEAAAGAHNAHQEVSANPHAEAAAPAADPHAAPAAAAEPEKADPHAAKEATPSPDPAESSPDHEVIVDMEILPGSKGSDTTAQDIFEKLKNTLQDPQSLLRTGPVGGILANGDLSYGKPPTKNDSVQQKAHESHSMGCMPSVVLLVVLTSLLCGFM